MSTEKMQSLIKTLMSIENSKSKKKVTLKESSGEQQCDECSCEKTLTETGQVNQARLDRLSAEMDMLTSESNIDDFKKYTTYLFPNEEPENMLDMAAQKLGSSSFQEFISGLNINESEDEDGDPYEMGYRAGEEGKPKSRNPFEDSGDYESADLWLDGRKEGSHSIDESRGDDDFDVNDFADKYSDDEESTDNFYKTFNNPKSYKSRDKNDRWGKDDDMDESVSCGKKGVNEGSKITKRMYKR